MAADRVEREILIEASPQVVWGVITQPDQISRWFSDEAQVEGRAGADGTLTWRPGGRGGAKEVATVVAIRVVEAEPFRRFSFRWNHPQGVAPDERNSALVEFNLVEEGQGTRLKVVESGIAAVTSDDEGLAVYVEEHDNGWARHLGELRDYVATRPGGSER